MVYDRGSELTVILRRTGWQCDGRCVLRARRDLREEPSKLGCALNILF